MCVFVCDRQLGLDLVPRRDFGMVDPDEISITELYRLVGSCTCIRTHTHIPITHESPHLPPLPPIFFAVLLWQLQLDLTPRLSLECLVLCFNKETRTHTHTHLQLPVHREMIVIKDKREMLNGALTGCLQTAETLHACSFLPL